MQLSQQDYHAERGSQMLSKDYRAESGRQMFITIYSLLRITVYSLLCCSLFFSFPCSAWERNCPAPSAFRPSPQIEHRIFCRAHSRNKRLEIDSGKVLFQHEQYLLFSFNALR